MLSRYSRSQDDTEERTKERKRFGLFRRRSKVTLGENKNKYEERDEKDLDSESSGVGLWKTDKKQKKIIYNHFSDDPKAVLEVETEDGIPEVPDKNSVVVKVQASTVSYNDCLLRRGLDFSTWDPVCCPATPGVDAVGFIVAMGENVTEWKEGDRVAALIQTGGNARYAVINQSHLVEVPRSLDSAEAACMVSTYMAAYQALKLVIGKERTLEGKAILVTGAIGPIGQALIQMAKRAGADQVYATAPTKLHRYVKSVLGAKALPMEPEDWLPEIEGKMDIVLDGVCQDGFKSPRKALSPTGTLVCVGMTAVMNSESMGIFGAPMSARWTQTKASYFMSRTKYYDIWSSFASDPKRFKTDLEHVFGLLRKHDIKPHVTKRVCLSEVTDSHVYLELGKSRGVIVCMPWKRHIPGRGVRAGKYGIDNEREN